VKFGVAGTAMAGEVCSNVCAPTSGGALVVDVVDGDVVVVARPGVTPAVVVVVAGGSVVVVVAWPGVTAAVVVVVDGGSVVVVVA
jgi:hypothetical protein